MYRVVVREHGRIERWDGPGNVPRDDDLLKAYIPNVLYKGFEKGVKARRDGVCGYSECGDIGIKNRDLPR